MKCPYNDCQKDYNEAEWKASIDTFISENNKYGEPRTYSSGEKSTINRIHLKTWECRFCKRYFHAVSVGNQKLNKYGETTKTVLEELATYPVSKTKFVSKKITKEVRTAFNEAERCRSVGSITGSGACLRKAIYTLCDEEKVEGVDYREKITNLKVKETHKELLKQFKWLGDNVTKPGEEKYTKEMVDVALEILPSVIDGLYQESEKEEDAIKMLAKARSANPDSEQS
jgi:hypothetical protein